MVAVRFKSPAQAADGFMFLVRQGRVRTLCGETYVCEDYALKALDAQQIPYEKIPLPLNFNQADALRVTPTTVL